jgi:hypothetical protein
MRLHREQPARLDGAVGEAARSLAAPATGTPTANPLLATPILPPAVTLPPSATPHACTTSAPPEPTLAAPNAVAIPSRTSFAGGGRVAGLK